MLCPACDKQMVVLEFRDIEIDYCPSCGGCWLDAGELGLILTGDAAFDQSALLQDSGKGSRRCPICSTRMGEAKLAGTEIRVDHCLYRHGIWLDAGELKAVIGAGAAPDRVATLSRLCDELFAHEVKGDRS